MVKKIIIIYVITLFACTENNTRNICHNDFLEISNQELLKEIIEYDKHIDSLDIREPYYLHIISLELNDSTNRYVIGFVNTPSVFKNMPFQMICKVNGKPVFFTMFDCIARKRLKPFFKMKDVAYLQFMREYFPSDYELYITKGITRLPNTWEGGDSYLTFINGKLIKKELKIGMPWE